MVELVGIDHPELITLLLNNRAKIADVIRWRQAASEADKQAIAEEMLCARYPLPETVKDEEKAKAKEEKKVEKKAEKTKKSEE